MGVKEWFRRYDQVVTIDVPKTEASLEVTLPSWPGMYTIKNINPKTSDDLFYFRRDENIIPGYIESDGTFSLNLIDGRKKLVKSFCRSYYHSVLDNLSELISAIEEHPDHDVILDISHIADLLDNEIQGWEFIHHFMRILQDKKIKYKLIKLLDYDIIYIDNFIVADYPGDTSKKTKTIYDFFKPSINTKDEKPFRNVFISRKFATNQNLEELDDPNIRSEGLSFMSDSRMDDHEELEKIFIDLGYEIVYSEMFDSFQDQIDYFHTAKTVASLTGSGLTNGAFMQPGGTLIEITTPLVVSIPAPGEPTKNLKNLYYVQELHNFYKNIAYYQDLYYFTIQNPSRSVEEFKKNLEADSHVRAFLKRNA
jgi:hypothetical protein